MQLGVCVYAAPSLPVLGLHKLTREADRRRAVERYERGDATVLVCTDLAARGIDVVRTEHVVQLDFAANAVAHLHRVGRTGRLDRAGQVTCILQSEDLDLADAIIRRTDAGESIEDTFSRGRSFRKRLRRAQQQQQQQEEQTASEEDPRQ